MAVFSDQMKRQQMRSFSDIIRRSLGLRSLFFVASNSDDVKVSTSEQSSTEKEFTWDELKEKCKHLPPIIYKKGIDSNKHPSYEILSQLLNEILRDENKEELSNEDMINFQSIRKFEGSLFDNIELISNENETNVYNSFISSLENTSKPEVCFEMFIRRELGINAHHIFPASPYTMFNINDHVRVLNPITDDPNTEGDSVGVISSQLSSELILRSSLGEQDVPWFEVENIGKYPSSSLKYEHVAAEDESAFSYYLHTLYRQIETFQEHELQSKGITYDKVGYIGYEYIVKYLQEERDVVDIGELEAQVKEEICELGCNELDYARQFGDASNNGHKRITLGLVQRSLHAITSRTTSLLEKTSYVDTIPKDEMKEVEAVTQRVSFALTAPTETQLISPTEEDSTNDEDKRACLHITQLYRLLCSGRFARDSLGFGIRSALMPHLALKVAINIFIIGKDINNETEMEKYETILTRVIMEANGEKKEVEGGNEVDHSAVEVSGSSECVLTLVEFAHWMSPSRSEEFVLGKVRAILQESKFEGDIDAMFDAFSRSSSSQQVTAEAFAHGLAQLGEVLTDAEVYSLITRNLTAEQQLSNFRLSKGNSWYKVYHNEGCLMLSRSTWRQLMDESPPPPLSRTLSTKGSFIEGLGNSFYGKTISSSFDSHDGGRGLQLSGPVTHAKFLSFVSRDLTADLSSSEISVIYVNLLSDRMNTVIGEYDMEMKKNKEKQKHGSNSLNMFGISEADMIGDDVEDEDDDEDEWLDKVKQMRNMTQEESTPEVWQQLLLEFGLPFQTLQVASPLVDNAVELDLVRFDTFLKVLREKILNKMMDDMHRFNESAVSSSNLGGGKHLAKRGATAWRIYLKALFECVDKDHSGAIDPGELFGFIENLWGSTDKAVEELIEPTWAKHTSPLGNTNMATVFMEQFRSKMMLAALKRYLHQLIDGLDFDGNNLMDIDELEKFLITEPEDGECEPPVAVAAVRYAFNRLIPSNSNRMNEGGQLGITKKVFRQVAKLTNSKSQNDIDAHALKRSLGNKAPLLEHLNLNHLNSGSGKENKGGLKSSIGGGMRNGLLPWQSASVVSRLDPSDEGLISFEEFEKFMLPTRNRDQIVEALLDVIKIHVEPKQSVNGLCRALDPDGNGSIGKGEIVEGLEKLGLVLTSTETEALWNCLNGWGMINLSSSSSDGLNGHHIDKRQSSDISIMLINIGLEDISQASFMDYDQIFSIIGIGDEKSDQNDEEEEENFELQAKEYVCTQICELYPRYEQARSLVEIDIQRKSSNQSNEMKLEKPSKSPEMSVEAWQSKIARARMQLGRVAPISKLYNLLLNSKSSSSPFPYNKDELKCYTLYDDAMLIAGEVCARLGMDFIRYIMINQTDTNPQVALRLNLALYVMYEAIALELSPSVVRILAQIPTTGQFICLTAGNGSAISTLVPQLTTLLNMFEYAKLPQSATPTPTLAPTSSSLSDASKLLSSLSLVNTDTNFVFTLNEEFLSYDMRISSLHIMNGGTLPTISKFVLNKEWFIPASILQTSSKTPISSSSKSLEEAPPVVFVSCADFNQVSKLKSQLSHCSLPSNGKIIDFVRISSGTPEAICFQCELGRFFKNQVPSSCFGERSASQLALLSSTSFTSVSSKKLSSYADSDTDHRSISSINRRRLARRGLTVEKLERIFRANSGAILEEYTENEGGSDDMFRGTLERKASMTMQVNKDANSVSDLPPVREDVPEWALEIEKELRAYASGGSSKKKQEGKDIHSDLKPVAKTKEIKNKVKDKKKEKKADMKSSISKQAGHIKVSKVNSEEELKPKAVNVQLEHQQPDVSITPPSCQVTLSSRQDSFCEEVESKERRKLNLPDVNFVFHIDIRGGIRVGIDSVESFNSNNQIDDKDERDVNPTFPFKTDPTWSFSSVVLQLMAMNRIRKWYLKNQEMQQEKNSYFESKTAEKKLQEWYGTPSDNILLGPYHTLAVMHMQLRLKSGWSRRFVSLKTSLLEQTNKASFLELRVERLESEKLQVVEASTREIAMLKHELRRSLKHQKKQAEQHAELLKQTHLKHRKLLDASRASLRASENAVKDAVLQERNRVTKYWRGKINTSYVEREERRNGIMVFTATELEFILSSFDKRGPQQRDEDRQRLRGISRRIRNELSYEVDPLPVTFQRDSHPGASALNKSTSSRKSNPRLKNRTNPNPVKSHKPVNEGPLGRLKDQQMTESSSNSSYGGNVTVGEVAAMASGLDQMKALLLRLKHDQDEGGEEPPPYEEQDEVEEDEEEEDEEEEVQFNQQINQTDETEDANSELTDDDEVVEEEKGEEQEEQEEPQEQDEEEEIDKNNEAYDDNNVENIELAANDNKEEDEKEDIEKEEIDENNDTYDDNNVFHENINVQHEQDAKVKTIDLKVEKEDDAEKEDEIDENNETYDDNNVFHENIELATNDNKEEDDDDDEEEEEDDDDDEDDEEEEEEEEEEEDE